MAGQWCHVWAWCPHQMCTCKLMDRSCNYLKPVHQPCYHKWDASKPQRSKREKYAKSTAGWDRQTKHTSQCSTLQSDCGKWVTMVLFRHRKSEEMGTWISSVEKFLFARKLFIENSSPDISIASASTVTPQLLSCFQCDNAIWAWSVRVDPFVCVVSVRRWHESENVQYTKIPSIIHWDKEVYTSTCRHKIGFVFVSHLCQSDFNSCFEFSFSCFFFAVWRSMELIEFVWMPIRLLLFKITICLYCVLWRSNK